MATTAQTAAASPFSCAAASWDVDEGPAELIPRSPELPIRPFTSLPAPLPRSSPPASARALALQWGAAAAQGQRSRMEDTHVGVLDLGALLGKASGPPSPSAFFGVFDGHSGRSAAEFARDRLLSLVLQQPGFPAHIPEALRAAYLSADEELYSDFSSGHSAGCTALTAMIIGCHLTVAHAGDSRAVLSRCGKAIQLTHDHKPTASAERDRIYTAGGAVCGPPSEEQLCGGHCCKASATSENGAALDYDESHIGVTRALGDFHLSQLKYRNPDDNRWQGPLIAEPEVHMRELQSDDEFVILACDGLWDVMSSQRAVEITRQSLRQHLTISPQALEAAAQSLVDHALEMHSSDNVTALIIGLQSSPPVNRSFRQSKNAPMSRVLSNNGLGQLAAALASASE